MKKSPQNIIRNGAKWLPGAMTVAAATSSTQAATVQITFANSFISGSLGDNLDVDFGDDGVANIVGFASFGYGGWALRVNQASDGLSTFAQASGGSFSSINFAQVVIQSSTVSSSGASGVSATLGSTLAPIRFSDANILNGALVSGFLQFSASSSQPGDQLITIERLIFDDATGERPVGVTANNTAYAEYVPVPEPSSVSLLALGAGGLLMRRRRKAA